MTLSPGAADWPAPLPDFADAAISQRIRIGERVFHLALSNVQHRVPFEPHTHLVQLSVEYEGHPLTPSDLGITSPDASSNAWGYLTNRLNETIVQFYQPRSRDTGELNPRLGCWGPRPDLARGPLAASDAALAVVLGASIWMPGANPPVDEQIFLEALRDTLVEVLTYWTDVSARLVASAASRLN